jgi:hypothetical protein
VAWIFASRASFGEGAGRFCQRLLEAVYAADNTIRVDAMRAEEVVSGLGIWTRTSHPQERKDGAPASQTHPTLREDGEEWGTRKV